MIAFSEYLQDSDVSWPTVAMAFIAALPGIIGAIAALIMAVRNAKQIGDVGRSVNGVVERAMRAREETAAIRAQAEASGINLDKPHPPRPEHEPIPDPRADQDDGRGDPPH